MNIQFSKKTLPTSHAHIIFVYEDRELSDGAALVDKKTGGLVNRAVNVGHFSGKFGQIIELVAPANLEINRLVVVGLGRPSGLDQVKAQQIGGKIMARLISSGDEQISIAADAPKAADMSNAEFAAHLGLGLRLRRYRF
ncbi:hypothetical protein MNBD_ALPHA01-1085, partial [hydrothermal vent metagenome]